MSRHSISWLVAGMAAMFVLSFAISEFVPDADAQQVLPGGRAANVRAYFADVSGTNTVIIPSVEGTHGFLITDILAYTNVESPLWVRLNQGGETVAYVLAASRGTSSGFDRSDCHFVAGIPLIPGQALTVNTTDGREAQVTISGYTY